MKKSNPQLTHLTPAVKSFTFKHLHPNVITADAFGSFPSPPVLWANRSSRAPSSTSRPALHPGRASPTLPAPRTQRAPEARHGAGGLRVPSSPRRGGCGNKATRAPRHRSWLFAGHPAASRPRASRGRPSAAPGPARPRARAPSYLLRVRRAHGRRPGSSAIMPRSGAGPSAAGRAGPGGAGRGGEAAGSRAPPPPPAAAAAAAGPRLSPDAGGGAGGAGREVSADGGAPGAPPRGPSRGPLPITAAEASGTAASPPGAAAGGGSPRAEARCGDCGERAAPRLVSP